MAMELEAVGGLAVASVVVHEVDGAQAAAQGAHGHATSCANCNATLAGEFCHQCGQHAHVHKSLLHLAEEVLHGILHFDTKAWRTIPMLVARPGQLTRRYIDGQRTRFVSPLALFLFLVFFLFFVASLTGGKSGVNLSGSPEAKAQARAELVRDVEHARAALRTAEASGSDKETLAEATAELATAENVLKKFEQSGVVASANGVSLKADKFNVETSWPAMNAAIKHAADNPDLTIYKLKSSGSKFSFLLVPISLPFLWLLFFWRRGVTMYDHAVFSLYSLSFMALMFALVFVISYAGFGTLAAALVVCLPPVHMFLQLRGAYALSRGEAFWRTLALLGIAGVVFLLYIGLILMLSVA
ncbi:DUF3667 domain-containing protein [Massilia antarctica]|uniref:DUF3667 domain-containing protein n=1 Tax=Massilia antarctica TaxID=2765360 RepID=A0AA48WC35_9BURK|nr:DUF3667 domain-containing protein [Massilia antarctica]QPI49191.1 DUF3667 domain-containing protein [Massilia antarctica]